MFGKCFECFVSLASILIKPEPVRPHLMWDEYCGILHYVLAGLGPSASLWVFALAIHACVWRGPGTPTGSHGLCLQVHDGSQYKEGSVSCAFPWPSLPWLSDSSCHDENFCLSQRCRLTKRSTKRSTNSRDHDPWKENEIKTASQAGPLCGKHSYIGPLAPKQNKKPQTITNF